MSEVLTMRGCDVARLMMQNGIPEVELDYEAANRCVLIQDGNRLRAHYAHQDEAPGDQGTEARRKESES